MNLVEQHTLVVGVCFLLWGCSSSAPYRTLSYNPSSCDFFVAEIDTQQLEVSIVTEAGVVRVPPESFGVVRETVFLRSSLDALAQLVKQAHFDAR